MYKLEIEKKFKMLNDKFIDSKIVDRLPIGLLHGKMGLCIYFYHISKLTNDKSYALFAEKTLDNTLKSIDIDTEVNFEGGLSGIGWGINYLISNNFVKASNINSVLYDIDNVVFRYINNITETRVGKVDLKLLVEILLYLDIRLRKLKKVDKLLLQDSCSQLLNLLYYKISTNDLIQPRFFALDYLLPKLLIVFSKLIELKSFNNKIQRFLVDLSPIILSLYPSIMGNRTYLIVAMQNILKHFEPQNWKRHIELLQNSINHSEVIENEFNDNNINFVNGISGYAYLLMIYDKMFRTDCLLKHKNDLIGKLANSTLWNIDSSNQAINYSLYSGLPGAIYTYYKLNNERL